MKYVIHSKSERGFWSNELGWCFDIESATRFPQSYVKMWTVPIIISTNSDHEWVVVSYDED